MSWDQLRSILREIREEATADRSNPPEACPNDGEPLRTGPNGELYCPFDGWQWDRQSTISR